MKIFIENKFYYINKIYYQNYIINTIKSFLVFQNIKPS